MLKFSDLRVPQTGSWSLRPMPQFVSLLWYNMKSNVTELKHRINYINFNFKIIFLFIYQIVYTKDVVLDPKAFNPLCSRSRYTSLFLYCYKLTRIPFTIFSPQFLEEPIE